MQYDLIIRGGTVVDGTGAEARVADVAITGDRIAEIGEVKADAREELAASGLLVTPGFVDLHTHLDAQIGWDPYLTPVSWHGVTTALLGNCGVTFAPCHGRDRETLAGMMETVEDIPKDAILSGLPWTWESYGDYLDALAKLQPAINVTGLVGHCALRYYVMGERGVEEQASAEERQQMAELAAQAVRDGAAGFSTSRFLGHYLPDGRHVPGTHAEHQELVEIAAAVGQAGGLMQNVLNFAGDFDGEMALLEKEAQTGGRVLFSLTAGASFGFGDRVTDRINGMRSNGLDINAICIPRGSGFLSGLQSNLLWSTPAWKRLGKLPFAERLELIGNESAVAQLVAEAAEKDPKFSTEQVFWLGAAEQPNYVGGPESSLAALAEGAGEHPAATYLRLARESRGRGLFTVRFFNRNIDALARLIGEDYCLPGLGDAGAHVSQIMDSGWATFVLSHWHRDTGFYPLEEAVRRITSAPARIIGLNDRGTLQRGSKADINVIDLARLGERMPEIVNDFPGGAPRFIQRGAGYRATLCNGQMILRDDELTGQRSGVVVRH